MYFLLYMCLTLQKIKIKNKAEIVLLKGFVSQGIGLLQRLTSVSVTNRFSSKCQMDYLDIVN